MDVKHSGIVAMKVIRFILLGSAALMICAVLLPANRIIGFDLMAKAGKLFVTQAFADSSKSNGNGDSKNSDKSSGSDNSNNSDKSSGSDKSSSNKSGGGSTDCLVCVPLSSTPLGSSSSGGSNSGDSKNNDNKNNDNKNNDNKNNDNKNNDNKNNDNKNNNSNKVSVCHSGGKSGNQNTLSIDVSAVPAHLAQGDSYGDCSSTVPTCAAMSNSGTVIGIWVPSSAVGNDTALNTYFSDIQAGTSSGLQACSTTNAAQSYRDIHGQ